MDTNITCKDIFLINIGNFHWNSLGISIEMSRFTIGYFHGILLDWYDFKWDSKFGHWKYREKKSQGNPLDFLKIVQNFLVILVYMKHFLYGFLDIWSGSQIDQRIHWSFDISQFIAIPGEILFLFFFGSVIEPMCEKCWYFNLLRQKAPDWWSHWSNRQCNKLRKPVSNGEETRLRLIWSRNKPHLGVD